MSGDFDLIVIGGGPAGASAAITAAREGVRVLLLERGRFPRHKVCGEFISAESLTLLNWLLGEAPSALLRNPLLITEARLLLDGRSLRIPVSPPAASISRYDLDLALWNAAQHAGVTALPETAVQQVDGETPFYVHTSGGEFRGRALINASGRWSNLGQNQVRHAQDPANGSRWLGLKAHMRGQTAPSVDLYFFEGGYCGVQPVRGPSGEPLINVCALFQSGTSATWDALLPRHPLLHARSREWTLAFPPLSTFPVIFREPCPVTDRVANAGDAAGFVDPFVGDGISLALRGGNMAACSLLPYLRGESNLDRSLEGYAEDYRRHLRPVYRASSLLRRVVRLPRVLRAPLLSACESSPRLARYLVESTRSRMA